MGDLQATIEFSVELHKFFNVDLFQRGLYQVRCALRVSPRLPVQVETNIPPDTTTTTAQSQSQSQSQSQTQSQSHSQSVSSMQNGGNGSNGIGVDGGSEISDSELQKQDLSPNGLLLGTACIINGAGASRIFQILYRNEEVLLRDVIHFRAHLLVDSRHLKESIERAEFSLHLELWFGEQNGNSNLSLVSTRTLQLNFHPARGLHYHLPVLFDYFHLAAISIGIHASLVALHQPYINAPRSSKPWISSGKLSCRGNISPGPLEAVFFGPQVVGTTKCSGGPAGRLMQSRQVHRDICALLLEAVENLKATLNEFSTVVPPSIRSQIGSPPLRQNDVGEKLQQLTDQAKVHDSEEDFAIRANSDIAQLCAECVMHWRRALIASTQPAVNTLLAKRHHILRVRRFAEGFFLMENPRHSAAGCYDSNYQNYVAVAEMARRSRYLQTLPPLPVHCTGIDGESNSLPLIFEDRYIEPPNYTRRRTGSDPHLNVHDNLASNASKSPPSVSNLVQYDKTNSISSLNGRTPKAKECSCGLSYGYATDSNYFAGVLTPRFAIGGDVLQASLTITPTAAMAAKTTNNCSNHPQLASRHSVTGLLDEIDCPYENSRESFGPNSSVTLPARHSKSLDQLDGTAVQSAPSLRTQSHIQTLCYEPKHRRQMHSMHDRSTSKSTNDAIFHAATTADDVSNQKMKAQAEDLMRNIFELRQKYKNCEVGAPFPLTSDPLSMPKGPNGVIINNCAVDSTVGCAGGTLNRQTETQLRAGKFDYLHEIKMLNPPKQPLGYSHSYYNSLPKGITNGPILPRNSYPPIKANSKLNGFVKNESTYNQKALTTTVAAPSIQSAQKTLTRSNSSQALSHKNHFESALPDSSVIPRSVEIARVRVSDIKEMLKNGKLRKESSSSESDIPSKSKATKQDEQKMLSSKSVPFRLETYNVANVTNAADSNGPNSSGFSESLPNLAQAPPPPQFDGEATPSKPTEVVVSNSTSSLSEESGWVSSRRSSCGPSSPETITNDGKDHQTHITSSMETKLNGEQLRLKLQKLLDQQNKVKKQRQANTASHNRNAAATNTAAEVAVHKRVSSVTLKVRTERHKTGSELRMLARNLVPNEESTELEDIERPHPQPPMRRERKHPKAYEKSKSEFDLTSIKDISLLENVRVPPPKQFQDDLLPPDEFRDPPINEAPTKVIQQLKNGTAANKPLTPKPKARLNKTNVWQLKDPQMQMGNSFEPPKKTLPKATNIQHTALKELSTQQQRKAIAAIDNPVYHIYESLKPISTPAIFTNKPVMRSHSIVEMKRHRDMSHLTQFSNGKGYSCHALTANTFNYNHNDDDNKENANFNGKHSHTYPPAPAPAPTLAPHLQQQHQQQQQPPPPPPPPTAVTTVPPQQHQLQHQVIITRSDSQKSNNSKSKKKNHEASISLLEFEKYREEFRKQIKYTGVIYSDCEKLASELPYFCISDEYRVFSPNGLHLIICVHGLDGNAADLRLVRTYLELGLPGANLEFLMSERNQGDTFSDFDTMTDRLVDEILYFIETCGLNPARISFVAHSLGTIIVRSALARPQMRPLLPRLHTFLSLSGPHLGTLYNTSGLVNMGLWFMQKWKKSGSLLQLCMRDTTDLRNSFLYRLSQRSTLHHFKNILLCGSSQDRYVPAHSARLELCKAAIRDNSNLGTVYREMVHNIIAPILARPELTLARYDVHHALPHTANTLIGRAAHIAVLDSELFIEKFLLIAGLKYFS